jgi:hypothetical protein
MEISGKAVSYWKIVLKTPYGRCNEELMLVYAAKRRRSVD